MTQQKLTSDQRLKVAELIAQRLTAEGYTAEAWTDDSPTSTLPDETHNRVKVSQRGKRGRREDLGYIEILADEYATADDFINSRPMRRRQSFFRDLARQVAAEHLGIGE